MNEYMEIRFDENGMAVVHEPYCTVDIETKEDFDMVQRAVNQYLEREKGCEVCGDNKVLDSCSIGVCQYVGGACINNAYRDIRKYKLTVRSGNLPLIQVCEDGEQCADANILAYKITYCPACGKRLLEPTEGE